MGLRGREEPSLGGNGRAGTPLDGNMRESSDGTADQEDSHRWGKPMDGIMELGRNAVDGKWEFEVLHPILWFDGRYSNITTSREFAWVYNIHKHLFDANIGPLIPM